MRPQRTLALAAAAGLLLTACGSSPPAEPAPAVPHGYVEGAEETAEPQSRLVIADARTGAVRVLDLLTGTVTRLDDVAGVRDISTDGRFAYLAAGGSTQVIDSGAWMVDHGDHVHYYRAAIRPAGAVDGHVVAAHADSAVAALAVEGGKTVLLDRAAQEDGTATRGAVLDGLAVPYAEQLVVASDRAVTVRGRDGDRVVSTGAPCREPAGAAPTRRGVVVGCADGALLLSEDDGRFTAAKIPYPEPVPSAERAREFTSRPGSATLTALAGERGVWVLDVAERTWRLIGTGPVVAVNAVGEGGPLLTLTADGVLHAYDAATGQRTASRPLMAGGVSDGERPVILVDTSRAYVNDPAGRRVYEVDYNDRLRIARTFDLDVTPSHVVETGR